jgi:hypothetical protein
VEQAAEQAAQECQDLIMHITDKLATVAQEGHLILWENRYIGEAVDQVLHT